MYVDMYVIIFFFLYGFVFGTTFIAGIVLYSCLYNNNNARKTNKIMY